MESHSDVDPTPAALELRRDIIVMGGSAGGLEAARSRTHIAEHFRGNQDREIELRVDLGHGPTRLRVRGRRFDTGGEQPLMLLALQEGTRETVESWGRAMDRRCLSGATTTR